jgi:hypothetical protein
MDATKCSCDANDTQGCVLAFWISRGLILSEGGRECNCPAVETVVALVVGELAVLLSPNEPEFERRSAVFGRVHGLRALICVQVTEIARVYGWVASSRHPREQPDGRVVCARITQAEQPVLCGKLGNATVARSVNAVDNTERERVRC